MIFPIVFCLFLCSASSVDIKVAFGMIKSALEYYNSHSVLLTFDDSPSSSDLFKLLTLQKRLSSGKNLCFSSLTSSTALLKSLKKDRGIRETIVIWNPNNNFPFILEELSREIDISSHKWFVTTSTLASEAFNNITIPLNSEFTIARGNPRSGYDLEEIYDVIPGMRLSNPLGRWSSKSQEFRLQAPKDIFARRKDFQGATIKVASAAKDVCIIESDEYDIWRCLHQELWYNMEKALNATTNVSEIPSTDWDTIDEHSVDLIFSSIQMTIEGMNTRDYIWPTVPTQYLVVTSYITQKLQWETFILPFRLELWMVTLLWIILWDFILAFVRFLNTAKGKKKNFFDCYNEFSFTTMFSFCSQGVLCCAKLSSTRIVVLMMFIVPTVLLRGYSAVLISFLTVQFDKQPFRNLEELSENNEYKLGWQKNLNLTGTVNWRRTSFNEDLRNKILQAGNDLPDSDEKGFERMCNEKFSFIVEIETLLYVFPKCKSFTFKRFVNLFVSMELMKGSWYKYYLDRCQRLLDYSGIKRKIGRQLLLEYDAYNYPGAEKNLIRQGRKDLRRPLNEFEELDDTPTVEVEVFPVQMENIILPFAVFLFGIMTSVIVLFLEIVFFRQKSKRLHKSTRVTKTTRHPGHYEFIL